MPALAARVIDQTGTLNGGQRAALASTLAAFEAQAGPQIVVLLVPTTAPEDIASYAQRVADAWKIGRRRRRRRRAPRRREERTPPASASRSRRRSRGRFPDLAARQIIDRAITPAFRAGDFAGGLDAAADQLIGMRIRGEGLPAPAARRGAERGPQMHDIGLFLFVAVPIVAGILNRVVGRKLGAVVTAGGAGAIAWWLTASLLLAVGAGVLALIVAAVFGLGVGARRRAPRWAVGLADRRLRRARRPRRRRRLRR